MRRLIVICLWLIGGVLVAFVSFKIAFPYYPEEWDRIRIGMQRSVVEELGRAGGNAVEARTATDSPRWVKRERLGEWTLDCNFVDGLHLASFGIRYRSNISSEFNRTRFPFKVLRPSEQASGNSAVKALESGERPKP